MHLVGIRRALAAEYPQLCIAICAAFEAAKQHALHALESYSSLSVSLPWAPAQLAQARSLMGHDFWAYGVERNRAAIGAIARYSAQQGLASRVLDIAELFAPASLAWSP